MSKLVRDKIPEIIKASGKTPVVYKVTDYKKQHKLLLSKLVEEAKETKAAGTNYVEVLKELADVYEVICTIADHAGLSIELVKEAADVKRRERGGFTEYYVLDETIEK